MKIKKLLSLLLLSFLFFSLNFPGIHAEILKLDDYEYYEPTHLRFVEGGFNSAAAINDEGRVFTWGTGDYGILGTGNTNSTGSPQDITESFGLALDEEVIQIAIGYSHMLARTNQNRIFGWGENANGSVGDNTTTQRNSPVEITSNFSLEAGENVIDVAAGINTSFVLTDLGKIFIWGANNSGALGNGQTSYDIEVTNQSDHFILLPGEKLIDIDVKLRSILALSDQGNLYGWGNNLSGELGTGSATTVTIAVNVTSAYPLAVDEEISAFSIGENHSIVATNEGNVYTVGANNYGQIGDGTAITRLVPVNISSALNLGEDEYVSYLDSHNHNLVVTNLGRVFAWGNNFGDQVSAGLNSTQITPYEITSLLNYDTSEICTIASTTLYNSFLISNQNAIYIWGNNNRGLLAQGIIDDILDTGIPIKIIDTFDKVFIKQFLYGNINKISSYATHTMVLTDTNRIFTWGDNLYGQIGNNTTTRQTSPLDITHFINLHPDEYITQIETGSKHSIVLTSENRIFTWGYNAFGQLGNNTKVASKIPIDVTGFIPLEALDYITSIFTGANSSFLVSNNNKIYAFGQNTYGQLGDGTKIHLTVPTDITSNFSLTEGETIVKIVGSSYHTMLYTSENKLYTWGENADGALGNNTTVDSSSPILINSFLSLNLDEDIENIDVGDTYSGLLTSEGRLFMWGENIYGSLGEGSGTNRLAPYEITNQFDIAPGEVITSLSIGGNHSIAHTSLGKTFAWGDNGFAQLGDNTQTDRSFPVQTTGFMDVGSETIELFELGYASSFVLTVEGNIYGFGRNNVSELGIITNLLSIFPIEKISSLVTELGIAHFTQIEDEILDSNPFIEFEIYLEYDLKYLLDTITISGTVYDMTDIIFDKGKIVVNIPNIYANGDTLSFTFEELSLFDSSVYIASGPVIQETSIIIDSSPPTFDPISDVIWELGDVLDLNQFVTNLTDDYDEDISLLIESEDLDQTMLGTYEITVTATDDYLNSTVDIFLLSIVDTTDPVLSYNGPTTFEVMNEIDIVYPSNYEPYYFLRHIDIEDNSINQVFSSSCNTELDITTIGTYSVYCSTYDYSGNVGELTFEVNVLDTTAPNFDFIPTQIIESGFYMAFDWDTLVTGIKDNSRDIITVLEETDTVQYDLPGVYEVIVSASDLSNNKRLQTFTVIVEDTTAPLFGEIINQTIEAGEFSDIDWTTLIEDLNDNSQTPITTYETSDPVIYNQIGTYTVSVSAEDISQNITTLTFTVTVEDTTSPVIILNCNSEIQLDFGDPYTEMGASVIDNELTEILVTIGGDVVNTSSPGTYTVTYNAQDASGNDATEVTRTIIVNAQETYLFAQLAPGIDSIGVGEQFIDAGVIVFSSLETTTVVTGEVNTLIAGTYMITYTITDTLENELVLLRYVTVYNKSQIVIFQLGNAKTTLLLDEIYQDGTCNVLIGDTLYTCVVKANTVNTSVAGVYSITYSYTYHDIEYTYKRYVFVYEGITDPILYYRKEEEGDFL